MVSFIKDLLNGKWLTGLLQYGVTDGGCFDAGFTDAAHSQVPSSGSVSRTDVTNFLTQYLNWSGVGTPDANADQLRNCFLVFLPPGVPMSDAAGACGYHHHAKYGKSDGDDNLFFSVISTPASINLLTPAQLFVDLVSYCVSHELAEMFTNPDDRGWFSGGAGTRQGCEIGDICECPFPDCSSGALTVQYMSKWAIEKYWSQKEGVCINPDNLEPDPVTGSLQAGWRWCSKCQGLHFAENGLGPCAAGGTHSAEESGSYQVILNPDMTTAQTGWSWCSKCQGLHFASNTLGPCPAGGTHSNIGSGNYAVAYNNPHFSGQRGWKWCHKCQGMFFAGNGPAPCPAGGSHEQVGSGDYSLFQT
jgi:hypothetical protein